MPPSAMIGTLCGAAARAHSAIAVIIGTPMPGDDARRADRPGADADLDGVDAEVDERLGRFAGRDVAGDEIHVRILPPDPPHHVEHALRVAVRGVDDEHVDVRRDERLGALERVLADADRRADAQPAEAVLAGVRVLDHLLDVLDGDQPLQHVAVVDDEQLLDLVPVQESRAPARASCPPAR